jgi:hypothetical protein
MEQLEFVDSVFNAAQAQRIGVRINNRGDRQIDFDNKSLNADDVRRLYQDIRKKRGDYSQNDMKILLGGNKPCAVSQFFELAERAGLCTKKVIRGKFIYHFDCVKTPVATA